MLFEFNNNLAAHNPNMMFITAFVAVYDPKTGELTYSNAGHNYPYIISDKLTALNTENGIIAGSFEDVEFPEYTVKMKPGDCLFMYTDGVTEAENKSGELLGEARLEEVLLKNKSCSADDLPGAVTAEINVFAQGAEQSDDMTMLTLQIKPD
jgi:sigma-B regulation protein RsbU (phosphoserine phosphatase)